VLYLRKDAAMAFEACELVKRREAGGESVLLIQTPRQGESVAHTLVQQRKESEVGPTTHVRGSRPEGASRERSKGKAGKGGRTGGGGGAGGKWEGMKTPRSRGRRRTRREEASASCGGTNGGCSALYIL
jgi:hypothetical protein